MIQEFWSNIFRAQGGRDDLHQFLAGSYLFQDLSRQEVDFLSQLVHVRQYMTGEVIFRQGDTGLGVFLIQSGNVDIYLHDPMKGSADGQDSVFITRLEASDFFGEIALVEEPSYRTSTAICSQTATLVGFFKPDLVQIMHRNPITGNKICLRLAEILGRRLRETTQKVIALNEELNTVRGSRQAND